MTERRRNMRALVWQAKGRVEVVDVPKPRIREPNDALVRVTSTAICGSDLHLYKVMAPYLTPGDVLGHEFMGVVEEVGAQAGSLQVGDRVVVPFNISCGHCEMCRRGLQSQCDTTQVREQDRGARLFGYTSMYGAVPGGQAEYVRVPQAQYGPIVVPPDAPDERYLYLSDILPTAWQGAKYAEVGEGTTVIVLGLGPVGQLATRVARHLGAARVIGVDRETARLEVARQHGVEVVDAREHADVAAAVLEMTDGRGADSVIEAVGMEAHGGTANQLAGVAGAVAAALPSAVGKIAMDKVGVDQLSALRTAFKVVRRGGVVSVNGVYGGALDPLPLATMFDRQVTVRMGQANVRRWTDELLEIVSRDEDVFGLESLATHHLSLEDAPRGYEMFQKKDDGCLKVVLRPGVAEATGGE